MYINTWDDVYTVDPFTGAYETDVTNTGNNWLTNTHSGYRWDYNDIAMRNDGRLMTLSGRPSSNWNANWAQTGRYQELDTGDAKIVVSDVDSAITTWEIDPQNPTALRSYRSDVEFEAMVHDVDSRNRDYRHVYAVGSIIPGNGTQYHKNLMFVLNDDGDAIQYYRPNPPMGTQRLGTQIVPMAYVMTQPTLFAVDASVTSPDDDTNFDGVPDAYVDSFPADGIPDNDIHDGDYFALSDVQFDPFGLPIPGITETFEFDAGLDILLETDAPLRVRDGDTFEFDFDPLTLPNPEVRFEFDSAEVLVLTPGFSNWQDGDRFTIGTGFSAVMFEFDKAGDGPNFGSDVLITPFTGFETAAELMTLVVDAINNEGTYQADGHVAGGEARISIVGNPTVAVASATGLSIRTEGGDGAAFGNVAIPFEETWHVVDFVRSIETVVESNLGAEVGYAHRAGTDAFGVRLTIEGVKYVDTDIDDAGSDADAWVWQAVGEDGVAIGNVPIPFNAADDASDIAQAVAQAINFGPTSAFAGSALAGVKTVTLYSVYDMPDETGLNLALHDSPIKIKPDAFIEENPLWTGPRQVVNGAITGMAYIGDQLYAVDDRGGLFMIDGEKANHHRAPYAWGFVPVDPQGSYNYYTLREDANGNRLGPETRYVAEVEYEGNLIQFTGLCAGPENVEGGRYADLLFATDSMYLYALNTEGELQPIFADGAYRVQLPAYGVRGVDFSVVDFNMWHQTWNRRYDDGHGIERTYDDSRIAADEYQDSLAPGDNRAWDSQGRTSWYFGLDDPRAGTTIDPLPTGSNFHTGPNADSGAYYTYDMPGGAHGLLTTSTFSLEGYSFQDKPTLYFTYFADTENTGDYDGLRAYISRDGAQWDLAATSTDLADGSPNDAWIGDVADLMERPGEPYSMVRAIDDSGGTWRQGRINLSKYAGEPNVQVRFDFSTASCLHVGDLYTTGEYLTSVPVSGETLWDGDFFSIDGQQFEFDLGYGLVIPNAAGAAIPDGEWFEVDDGTNRVRFEFDKDFNSTDVPIYIGDADGSGNYVLTSSQVAVRVASAINLQVLLGNLDVYAYLDNDRVLLVRAVDVEQAPPPTVSKVTLVGDEPGSVSAGSVPVPLVGEFDRFGASPGSVSAKDVAEIITETVNQHFADPQTSLAIRAFDVSALPPGTVDGMTFTITGLEFGFSRTYVFELDTDGSTSFSSDIPVDIREWDSATTLALKITEVINTDPALATFDVTATRMGSDIVLSGGYVTFDAGTSLLEELRYADTIQAAPGLNIGDTSTFSIRGVTRRGDIDTFTFGFFSGTPFGSDIPVRYTGGDSADAVAWAIAKAINTEPAAAELNVVAMATGGGQVALYSPLAIFDAGNTPLVEVNDGETTIKWDVDDPADMFEQSVEKLMHVIGHHVDYPGKLGHGDELFGDHVRGGSLYDRFTRYERGQDNRHEGFYIDDVIVGFAERGEMVTASSPTPGGSVGFSFASITANTPPLVLDGEYQLEIRRAEDYGIHYSPPASWVDWLDISIGEQVNTNHRLAQGFTLKALSASEIYHGQSFTISDGLHEKTFVFIDETVGGGGGEAVPIYFNSSYSAGGTRYVYTDPWTGYIYTYPIEYGISGLIKDAINGATDLDVTAETILTDERVDLFGAVWVDGIDYDIFGPTVTDNSPYATQYDVDMGRHIGDQNLRREKGQITIEANSIMYSQEYGIVVGPAGRDTSANWPHPASGRTLNAPNDLVPGIMIENNLLAFGGTGGIHFSGDTSQPTGAVPFGRIVNNTIYGGSPSTGGATPGTYGGIYFPQGAVSFADQVVSYEPDYGGGPVPDPQYANPDTALGTPDFVFPNDGSSAVSLGNGGRITLAFTDNLLTGSGDNSPDLHIFEVGRYVENVLVEISPDGFTWYSVGTVTGATSSIDIDAYGFGLNDLFAYVRLTDDATQGEISAPAPGADIDAVGVITTVVSTGGTGIRVDNNASPTILNNIVANFQTGIYVDASSVAEGTVIGATIYQRNDNDVGGSATLGNFDRQLLTNAPLFVNPDGGNFYLQEGSEAIDSSVGALEERQGWFNDIVEPVGIPVSPITAPDLDLFGQLRVDDPNVSPPPGLGSNVFKDRGAIDRVDFEGPTASLVVPLDNDPEGLDRDRNDNDVTVAGEKFTKFSIQLMDAAGVGVDDMSVITPPNVLVYENLNLATYPDPLTRDAPLTEGVHYFLNYDSTNDVIHLVPAPGIWGEGNTYTIILDNTQAGIRDLANNPLQPNRFSAPFSGLTVFNVSLAGLDYGDAPDPTYPSLLENDGARHLIAGGYYLGSAPSSESDARENSDATGDLFDDGVWFDEGLIVGRTVAVTVSASQAGQLEAWIDFNADGDWDDAGEKLFGGLPVYLQAGDNSLLVDLTGVSLPGGVDEVVTFGRFRFWSGPQNPGDPATLSPTGEAFNGEVEDYQLRLLRYGEDYGDAPETHPVTGNPLYPTTRGEDGARHRLSTGLWLGASVDPELDGQPNSNASGDDDNPIAGPDDEDGIQFVDPLIPGNPVNLIVTSSMWGGYLNGWIDYNKDGDWDDAGEQIFTDKRLTWNYSILDHQDMIGFTLPAVGTIVDDATYARFRLSSIGGLGVAGLAADGEVEDYRVTIVSSAIDYGDAPNVDPGTGLPLYPTMFAEDGARHNMTPNFCLGQFFDYEFDGQPDATATGDDVSFLDDEDGIEFIDDQGTAGQLRAGKVNTIQVDVTSPGRQGYLNAWIDYNGDGDWDDPDEKVFDGLPVADGMNVLSIAVPEDLVSIDTFARFRFSSTQELSYTTTALEAVPDGEVEDYMVPIIAGDASISGWKFDDLNADGDRDTAGAFAVPNVQFAPPGSGAVVMAAGDDNASSWLEFSDDPGVDFTLQFFGNNYDRFYVNNNGVVTFTAPLPDKFYIPAGFPQSVPLLAPFWADVDTRIGGGNVHLLRGTSSRGNPFVQIDWVDVGYYNRTVTGNLDTRNTFSVYIEDDPGGDIVAYQYWDMNWTTGDTTGTGGFGLPGNPTTGAQIGFDAGDFAHYVSEARPSTPTDLADLLLQGQYVYRFDPATGERAGAEPGVAGVVMYIDENNNGQLDYADLDGDGEIDFDTGEPIERWTTTIADDPTTPGVDETGYYEFSRLFADTYVVREYLVDPDWVQTYPAGDFYAPVGTRQLRLTELDPLQLEGALLTLTFDDGSGGGPVATTFEFDSDGSFDLNNEIVTFVPDNPVDAESVAATTATVINNSALGLDVTATPSRDVVSLAVIVPGTTIDVSAFGPFDDVTSHAYYTVQDGGWYVAELEVGESLEGVDFGDFRKPNIRVSDAAIAEGHSGVTEVQVSLHLTESFGAPVTVYYHTSDGTGPNGATEGDNDYVPVVSGSHTFTPQGVPVGVWSTESLTRNVSNDYDYNVWGNRIVWEGHDGHDWEIYLYDYGSKVLTQLSDNDMDDRVTSIYGSHVAWVAGSGNDAEIFLYDIATGLPAINISNNSVADSNPRVSDSYVIWESQTASDQEIFLYDISAGGPAINISDNDRDDYEPQISGENVVWSTYDGVDREIYLYQVSVGVPQQLTSNNRPDRQPQIDGSNIVWEGYDGNDYEIFLYQIGAGTPPLQITSDIYNDSQVQISGENIVWTGYDPGDGDFDIYHYNTVIQWTSNVSRNNLPDEYPRIAGERIVWNAQANNNWEVFYSEVGAGAIPVDVSNHPGNDWKPQVSEELVVWRSYDQTDYEIVVATQAEPEVTETITLYINGDTAVELDEYFYLDIELAPEWVGLAAIDDGQAEVWILNDDGQLDYGDAPAVDPVSGDPWYPTLLADNGARHVSNPALPLSPIWLGSRVDAEGDGQPNATATGDDVVTSDDEDGVVFESALVPGANAWITVTASAAGRLDAWIDFDGDGDWGGAGEQIFSSENLSAGDNLLMYSVPTDARLGETFARFRFSSLGGLSYTGSAPDGEVEDYAVQISSATHGVEITESDGSTDVSEDGAGDSYTVALTSQPAADVQISLATPDGQLHVTPTVLTFTTINWATPQVVTVNALDDDLAEGLHSGAVAHTATSTDLNYNNILIPDVIASITDNDTAGVEITESDGTTNVSEDGATDSYQVVLTSEPTADVRIDLTPDSQVGVVPTVLVFTSADWYIPQVVTVSAVDDGVPEGSPHTGTVSHSASSLDPNYSVIFVRDVTASITDNDPAEVRITESDGYTEVSEDGDVDAYDVVLTMQPTAPVVVTCTPDGQLDMAPIQLTFNQFNWSTPQQVVVSALDDAVLEGPHTGTITHSVSSTDANYDGIAVADVTVNIVDNDAGVWIDGRRVIVQGSSGDDVFEFTGGDPHTVVINGEVHQYAAADVDEVVFDGGGGNNRAIFNGTAADELMEIGPDSGKLTGGGIVVSADNVRWVEAHTEGGNDTVRFDDSPTDDTVVVWPHSATMSGATYSHQVDGYEILLAYAKAGGNDTARLYDSAGNEQFESTPVVSWMTGSGFFNRVKFFDVVLAYAKEGGNDTATFHDSPGNDAFAGGPGLASMSGSGYFTRAKFFDSVSAYASGGYDYAMLDDSPGDDMFIATPEEASLSGVGFSLSTYDFDAVHAYAKSGGTDVAKLYDSINDDVMVATPTYAKLTGLGFYNRAKFFDYVHGYAKRGGRDVAYLYDSSGDDTFVGTPTASSLSGTGFYDRAKFFEEVYATASGGNDEAYLYDSAGTKDRLEGFGSVLAPGHWASVSSDDPALDYMYWISDFDRADAWASDVEDEENVDPSTVDWLFTHGW